MVTLRTRHDSATPFLLAVFAAPVAWAIALMIAYSLAASRCFATGPAAGDPHRGLIGGVFAVALIVSIGGVFLSLRERRRADAVDRAARRALASCGFLSSVLFAAAIVYFGVALAIGPPC